MDRLFHQESDRPPIASLQEITEQAKKDHVTRLPNQDLKLKSDTDTDAEVDAEGDAEGTDDAYGADDTFDTEGDGEPVESTSIYDDPNF